MKTVNITGGGLAGLSLGIALRRRKVPVRIVEAGTYPRHRVCGEFITGVGSRTLQELGVDDCLPDALELSGTVWYSMDRPVYRRSLPREAWGISRFQLDGRLAQRFEELGGSLSTGKRVRRDNSEREGHVWAAGRSPSREGGNWLGLKVHLRGPTLEEDLELHMGQSGYAGISRIENGQCNLCGLFRQDRSLQGRGADLLRNYLEVNGLKALQAHMEAGEIVADSFCAVAGLHYGLFRQPGRGFVLGDNWMLIPPFTGNGMSLAFESALLALPPLLEWSGGKMEWEDCLTLYRRLLRARLAPRVRRARFLHGILLLPQSRFLLAWLARKDVLPFAMLYGLTH